MLCLMTITLPMAQMRSLARPGAVVRYEHQQGKEAVIRSMFRDIDAQCYLMIDGDDTYPASDAAQMVDRRFKTAMPTWSWATGFHPHILRKTKGFSTIPETKPCAA